MEGVANGESILTAGSVLLGIALTLTWVAIASTRKVFGADRWAKHPGKQHKEWIRDGFVPPWIRKLESSGTAVRMSYVIFGALPAVFAIAATILFGYAALALGDAVLKVFGEDFDAIVTLGTPLPATPEESARQGITALWFGVLALTFHYTAAGVLWFMERLD